MKLVVVALLYLIGPIVVIALFQRNGIARKLGTILLSYALGIIMSLSGLMDFGRQEAVNAAAIQEWIMNIAVPLAIPLMLFSSDFKLWTQSVKKTVAALLGGVISVVLAIVAGFLLFHNQQLSELWKVSGMFHRKNRGKTALGLLLSLGFLVVGAGVSLLFTGRLNELVVIFTITTLAICASFITKIRTLPKTFELGMYFINVFSVVIASQFDLANLNKNNLLMLAFIGFVIVAATVLHLLISRLFKVDGDLFTVAHVGLLYSPPFVPPVVAAMGNRKVLISGIVIGLAGYAIGTYLGVAVASLFRLI